MNNHPWVYLRCLQPDADPEQIHELIRQEPGLKLFRDPSSGQFPLNQVSVSIQDSIDEPDRNFFRWWFQQITETVEARRDALTGLHSRSYWEREKAGSPEEPWTSVGMFDLDHFKQFNDNYGHDMGDRVLEVVGSAMRDFFDREFLVRYGGEEFLIVFRDGSDESSRKLDQFREQISTDKLFPEQPQPITFSGGVCGIDSDGIKRAIQRADRALYESKRLGRNRVTPYGRHLENHREYYVWGQYRYLRDRSLRYDLGDRFLTLSDGETLVRYRWSQNSHRRTKLPETVQPPLRQLRVFDDDVIVLDQEGRTVRCSEDKVRPLDSADAQPPLVGFIGRDPVHGIGINNQLYRLDDGSWEPVGGLPETWDRVARYGDDCFVEVDQLLIKINDSTCVDRWSIPFRSVQWEGGSRGLYGLSRQGTLYSFEPEESRFQKIQLQNVSNPPVIRSFSVHPQFRESDSRSTGDRLLMLDAQSRLLMARTRKKSVAQRMDIPDFLE